MDRRAMGTPDPVQDEPRAASPARALLAAGLLLAAAGCSGGGVRQLADQVPATSSAVGRVPATPMATPPTPPLAPVAPGAPGGPGAAAPPSTEEPPVAATVAPATTGPAPADAPAAPGPTPGDTAALSARLAELSAEDATLFAPDTTSLDGDGRALVRRVADVLRAHPGVRVEVAGHTDTNGDPASNLRISQQRAEAVRDRLIAEGIEGGRLVATGYGESRPRDTNETVAGRARNRRIEFTVLA